jgi:hypothetical protein
MRLVLRDVPDPEQFGSEAAADRNCCVELEGES